MSDIKPKILELAAQLKKEMKLNASGIIEVSPDAFVKTLEGTGIDETQVKALQKHTADVFAASMHAAGEIGVAAMKKDKKLDQVSMEMPVLKDSISHVILRSKEVMAGMPKEGEDRPMKISWGNTTSRYLTDVSGTKGDAKKVRAHIGMLAEEAFGKK